MTYSFAVDEEAFLRQVAHDVPKALRHVAFASILHGLVRWSQDPTRRLHKQTPGKQHTVAFTSGGSEYALWKAYPRTKDGAKVEVLTRLLHHLTSADRDSLLTALTGFAPTVKVSKSGVLMMPMHLLADDTAFTSFLSLLSAAHTSLIRARPVAG